MKTNSNNIKIKINPIFSFLLLNFFLIKIYINKDRTKILITTETFKFKPSSIIVTKYEFYLIQLFVVNHKVLNEK